MVEHLPFHSKAKGYGTAIVAGIIREEMVKCGRLLVSGSSTVVDISPCHGQVFESRHHHWHKEREKVYMSIGQEQ